MTPFKKVQFKVNNSPNFDLTVAELKEYIDFEVKRIYYIQDFKGPTGAHCHYKEDELFVMVRGNCTAVIDQGNGIEEIPLAQNEGIYAGHLVWHGFKDFSEDSILLAVSSTNYNPDRSDYLDNYEEYLKIRDEKLKEYT